MIKKIEILGIRLDNYTVREAMLLAEGYLENDVMNTIESITMETLVLANKEPRLKEEIEALDLAIVNEKEILMAAEVGSPQRIRETVEKQFFSDFMKRVIRNCKTVYLLGETKEETEKLRKFLSDNYARINIVGGSSLAEWPEDSDGAINEINSISPDIIFSVLPSPEQEYFLMENKGKLNAKIWYGLGKEFIYSRGVSYFKHMFKRVLHKGLLRSMLSKYKQENME